MLNNVYRELVQYDIVYLGEYVVRIVEIYGDTDDNGNGHVTVEISKKEIK
jgi:hypothetical protein